MAYNKAKKQNKAKRQADFRLKEVNMKSIVKGILSVMCAGALAFSLVGCNEKQVISAYDIAVKNGFVGTEQEWLQSLHGKDGQDAPAITIKDLYDEAKNNGFTGTYLDFCTSLGINAVEDNNVTQIAENMMSVVGIYCGFTKTTYTGGVVGKKEVDYSLSAGSGVILSLNKDAGSAIVVTNYHVLYNKDSDTAGISDYIYLYLHGATVGLTAQDGVGFNDGGKDAMRATFVGGAMDYDVAILKIEGSEYLKNSNAVAAKIGDSELVTEGEKVYAIGNPDGAGISVTGGLLSVKSEYIDIEALDERDVDGKIGVDTVSYRVMRTDTAINGGNSGGALFNAHGELIGITNAKSVGTDKDNMGYALPMLDVQAVCQNVLDNGLGCVKRATLGVMVGVESSVAEKNEDGTLNVVQVITVASDVERSATAYNLLKKGDRFLWGKITNKKGVTGEAVTFDRRYQLNALLLNVRQGDTLTLGILRDGEEVEVEIPFLRASSFTLYR